ncbi:DUF433 domain-containing protein [Accumulibacter sp.]|uniref:DUF433 domain-containing protein n=1 Tax=Accumulibacter sp. TaxID=2053492 RepID=UPI0025CB9078|nr:DUF433 domain-containing protein [Accumulibacter sp.]MCM8624866.1 DUF433 domain-containing protein [Accumulibacter sp.]
MNHRRYITRAPAICGGEPIVAGTRVTLRTVLSSLAEGMAPEAIVADFPSLTEASVRAVNCLRCRVCRGRPAVARHRQIPDLA